MRSQSPRIARLLGVRPGEGRLAARVALLFALIEAARGFGEIGVDTLVLSRLGAPPLPYLFVGLGITSLVVALAYGAALGRLARVPLFVGILLGVAALALVQRVALGGGATDVVSPLWLTIYAAVANENWTSQRPNPAR